MVGELAHGPLGARCRQIPLIVAHLAKASFELVACLAEGFEGVHDRHVNRPTRVAGHAPGWCDELSDPTGLCPGNSLNSGGFEFISNAPACEGACEGFPTDVGSVRVCTSNVWLYNTKIPNDSVGDLYGSLEKLVDGTFVGSTAVATNTAGTPPIDYTAPGYTISAMFTIDGATSITYADALT